MSWGGGGQLRSLAAEQPPMQQWQMAENKVHGQAAEVLLHGVDAKVGPGELLGPGR